MLLADTRKRHGLVVKTRVEWDMQWRVMVECSAVLSRDHVIHRVEYYSHLAHGAK